MKLVIQRVKKAKVLVEGKMVGEIGHGLFVLVGVQAEDNQQKAEALAEKLAKLRVMSDKMDKMNLTVGDVTGSMLVVSQFTLYADTSGGNRPSFIKAARPEAARPIYEHLVERLRSKGITAQTGQFGEYMEISVELDGPVTIIMET